jgi:hypothetical protein
MKLLSNRLSLLLLFFFFAFSLQNSLKAQEYDNAVGLRLGFYNGVTFKHSLDGVSAVEGILTSRWRGFSITALYEYHFFPFDVDGLYAFVGAGGHLGYYNGENVRWLDNSVNTLVIGADGILGIEYTFADIPLCLTFDWKPIVNLIGSQNFLGGGFGLSARYILD